MYRSWLVAHQELSPNTLMGTPLQRAQAAEARGAGEARSRPARPRRHGHAELLRAHHRPAAVRDRAAGGAAGAAVPRDRAAAGAARPGGAQRRRQGGDLSAGSSSRRFEEATLAMDNARLDARRPAVSDARTRTSPSSTISSGAGAAAVRRGPGDGGARAIPDLRAADEALRAAEQDVRRARSAFLPSARRRRRSTASRRTSSRCTGVAARSRARRAAEPRVFRHGQSDDADLGLGRLRSKLRQSQTRAAPGAGRAEPDAAAARQQPVFDLQRSAGGAAPRSTACGAAPISPPKACV